MDHQKFAYWTERHIEADSVLYFWYLVNRETKNGVHFHGIKYHPKFLQEHGQYIRVNRHNFSNSGIERHASKGSGKPSQKNCRATTGDCWHDGTSLAASERLGHVNPDRADEEIWSTLHGFYESWFREDCRAARLPEKEIA